MLAQLQLPGSHGSTRNHSQLSRRASLPFSTKPSVPGKHFQANPLQTIDSPNVSVNAPRIDKIAEFPLSSSEDPLLPGPRTSSTSAQCSSDSPDSVNKSVMKDKCMIQNPDKTSAKPTYPDNVSLVAENGSESSENNPVGGASSRTSSESRQHRFDTSSYQQRAEALEGLLEFSARLLQQERFQELGVLLKPFGLEKVSPRETAIWLTKSFKDTAHSRILT